MSSNNILIVQRGKVGSGEGDDTYLLSANLIDSNSELTITDIQGSNTIHFIDGLEISSYIVASNTALFTLSNGTTVTILDASSMTYQIGGNPLTGIMGTQLSYNELASQLLKTSVPNSGTSNGGPVTVNQEDLGTFTSKKYFTATEEQLRSAVADGTFAIESDGITYTFGDSQYNIDTSQITDMSYLFHSYNPDIKFNEDIVYWDVSNVNNMRGMFYDTDFNQDIGSWDTSNVTDMYWMFASNSSFNQDIGNWDVSNVNRMSAMFMEANNFNQDIGNWDISKVINTDHMFMRASNFNQNIGNWDTSNVTNMASMFMGASSFNQDIGNWNTSKVIYMEGMFS